MDNWSTSYDCDSIESYDPRAPEPKRKVKTINLTDEELYTLFKVNFIKGPVNLNMSASDKNFLEIVEFTKSWNSTYNVITEQVTPNKWIIPNAGENPDFFAMRFHLALYFFEKLGASPSTAVTTSNLIMGKLIFGISYGAIDAPLGNLVESLRHKIVVDDNKMFM
jgi:hypothetical protein